MSGMVFAGGVQYLMTVDDNEARSICWAHCQNDDDDKSGCFWDDCPLGSTELQRLIAINNQRRKGFTPAQAAAIMASCCT